MSRLFEQLHGAAANFLVEEFGAPYAPATENQTSYRIALLEAALEVLTTVGIPEAERGEDDPPRYKLFRTDDADRSSPPPE